MTAAKKRADLLMVARGLAATRQRARELILAGKVLADDFPVTKPGSLLADSAALKLKGEALAYVSRGGLKLEAALVAFDLDVDGACCLDVGASTGGFTDCLLQRGALSVVALDVGYGQLHHRLRSDDRVTVVERTNVRHADPARLGAPFDVVVADLSFISLALVAPQISALGGSESDWVLLVKPQFEAGKGQVGRSGIVREPEVHAQAIEQAVSALARAGIGTVGLIDSSITGSEGNREFLVHGRRGERSIDAGTVRAIAFEEHQP